MKRILACLIALVASHAGASTWTKDTGWLLKSGPDNVYQVLPGPGGSPPVSAACSGGNCTLGGAPRLPFNPSPTLTTGAPFTKGAVISGVAGLAGRLLPWVAVGTALYDWLHDAGIQPSADGSEFQEPNGQQSPSSQTYSVTYGVYPKPKYSTAVGACTNFKQWFLVNGGPYMGWPVVHGATSSVQTTVCTLVATYNASSITVQAPITLHAGTSCVFSSTGEASGLLPTGGLCPQGTLVTILKAQVESRLASTPISDVNLGRALREVLDAGGSVQDAGASSVSGPARVTRGTTTKTTSTENGTQQVTTTTTYVDITYNQNTVTINQTKVTENPDGTTTEETEEKKPDGNCEQYPNSLGCADMGTLPTDAPTWQTKTIDFQPQNMGVSGACPAPWSATIHGFALSMSYQPACDVAPMIRAGVLLMAGLMSLFFIVTAVRS
jgi:hypothetical protein